MTSTISPAKGNTLPLFFTWVVVLIAFTTMQNSYAASLTMPIEEGNNDILFRDISNLEQTPSPTFSLDKTSYHNGDIATLTVSDFNGNVDVNSKDTISVIINSKPVILEETEISSGIFVGTFLVSGNTDLTYEPLPPEAARSTVTIDASSAGEVVLRDFIITKEEADSLFFRPVTHGLDVEFANGATQTGGNIIVKISFANALFDFPEELIGTQMYYRNLNNGIDWTPITFNFDCESGSINCDELTVTSDPENAGITDQITEGQFILGVDTGGLGGGGGGLIRPGLVLNVLAGTLAGNSGVDTSPPSLVFGKSSTNKGFAGFLFGKGPEPDLFAPILPTQDSSINVPLKINDNGFSLTGFSNTIQPVKIQTGNDVDLRLSFLDASEVTHVALHFVDKNIDEMSDTDPIITFDNGNVIKSDPNGILGDQISFASSTDGIHHNFNFAFSFDDATNRNLMITAWDEKRNSANTKIFNAFEVTGEQVPTETNHLHLQNLGQFIIMGDYVSSTQPQIIPTSEIGYEYPGSIGKIERHDSTLYDNVSVEKAKANQVTVEKFNLDSETFVLNKVKSFDTSDRASELSWTFVGHKLRDFTKTPEENKELIKELSWQEHLKAEKKLNSLLLGSKYHS